MDTPERAGPSFPLAGAVVANAAIATVAVAAGALHASNADLYYRTVQEDEAMEWATFWAFAAACGLFALAAWRQWRGDGGVPWFYAGVALFCFVVAMEEISWGQRLLGYRPPTYFLANNFQQEVNVHNIVDTGWRKLALRTVILGYGVVLAVLGSVPAVARWMTRLGVEAPPLALAPGFFLTYLLYEVYPFTHTGEWVEAMLGMGFAFAGLAALPRGARWPGAATCAGVAVGLGVAGGATAGLNQALRSDDPALVEAARIETQALAEDFFAKRIRTRCRTHRRIYTLVEKSGASALRRGRFVGLVAQGMSEDRAEFFLDPWNSPYWVRDVCPENGPRRVVVYSFGPNRIRDLTGSKPLGDDVGAMVR